jgi:hypothetical protein
MVPPFGLPPSLGLPAPPPEDPPLADAMPPLPLVPLPAAPSLFGSDEPHAAARLPSSAKQAKRSLLGYRRASNVVSHPPRIALTVMLDRTP